MGGFPQWQGGVSVLTWSYRVKGPARGRRADGDGRGELMKRAWLTGTSGLVTLVAAVVLMWHSAPGATTHTTHTPHTTSVVVQTTKH